jgi:phosphoribosylformylglycinamidine synthase subunit PurL
MEKSGSPLGALGILPPRRFTRPGAKRRAFQPLVVVRLSMIAPNVVTLPVLERTDDEVVGEARRHGVALTVDELRRIAERLGRDPTIVEVHAFDAQWSEHCSYKSSRAFLSLLPTTGPSVVLGPGEDAGIVHLGEWEGERYGIVVAHESHNHPSQVVPFEGAATGIGGIVRDVLCMGARVIAVADPLRFGPLDDPHCRYVAQGAVDGIAAYGNAIGVPNIAGDVYFHEGFRDNCLVNVVALGLVNERDIIHSRAPEDANGWDIVLVGKATDRSGFGGAAFSSLVLDEEDAEANKGAVQVPDPFLKNVIMHATYRVFDVLKEERLTVGFKDLGAGGIMGCSAELVASGGFGAVIDLDRCPTSLPNLPPAVIAVGETQERLCWVVPPHFTSRLLAIYNQEYGLPEIAQGACAAIIGQVHDGDEYVMRWHGEEVMRVPIDFLNGGVRYERPYEPCFGVANGDAQKWPSAAMLAERGIDSLSTILECVLSHPDVCSRRPIFERYDSVVRGSTSIPCGYADAGVVVPIPGAPLAVALAVDGNPRYGAIDPRGAAELAVVESIRNVVAVGARPVALTDCLNFGDPENPRQFGEFVAAVEGLARAASELGVPFVSGNVSLYNHSASGIAIPASPIVACLGIARDVSTVATMSLKRVGSSLYRLGTAGSRLGGSVFAEIYGVQDARLPLVDYDALRNEIAVLLAAFERGLVLSAHDISDGGLLAALAEMAFASFATGHRGIELERDPDVVSSFAEASGFIVEVTDTTQFEAVCHEHGVSAEAPPERLGSAERIGRTIADPVLAAPAGTVADLLTLYEAWSAPLRDFYGDAA